MNLKRQKKTKIHSNLEGIVNRDVLSVIMSSDSLREKYWKSKFKSTNQLIFKNPEMLYISFTIFWTFHVENNCAISSLIIVPFERDAENFHKFFFESIKKNFLSLPIINVSRSLVEITEPRNSSSLAKLVDEYNVPDLVFFSNMHTNSNLFIAE